MKKALLFLILIGAAVYAYYLHDKTYYSDTVEFLPPIAGERLVLRNDQYGEGHFGAKRKNGRIHKGVDITAKAGTPVLATKSGWAISRFDKDGYGNYVKVYHKNGIMSLYGHLEGTAMRWIKKVRQGDAIGWVGTTGNARARGMTPHLHFELRKNDIAFNPMEALRRQNE